MATFSLVAAPQTLSTPGVFAGCRGNRAEQELLRIARDLRDVVAHTLTTIKVQGDVAGHLADRVPGDGFFATVAAYSMTGLAMACGSRPARSQPAAVATSGTPVTASTR